MSVLKGNKMAKDKDSIILYQKQMDKCRKFLNAEQFGRLIIALLDFAKGNDPEVEDDIAMAFEFTSLQQEIDRKKYEEICAKNRANGRLGGAPKGNKNAAKPKQPKNNLENNLPEEETTKTTETTAETLDVDTSKQPKQPKQPNGVKNNPNDKRMIREEKIMISEENDTAHHHDLHFGTFENVELTETERDVLRQTYERSDELIDKVSIWLRGATNEVPDHYALCIKFATNDAWPKRKVIPPVEVYEVQDPLSEEEQEERVAEMRARLNKAIPDA